MQDSHFNQFQTRTRKRQHHLQQALGDRSRPHTPFSVRIGRFLIALGFRLARSGRPARPAAYPTFISTSPAVTKVKVSDDR